MLSKFKFFLLGGLWVIACVVSAQTTDGQTNPLVTNQQKDVATSGSSDESAASKKADRESKHEARIQEQEKKKAARKEDRAKRKAAREEKRAQKQVESKSQ